MPILFFIKEGLVMGLAYGGRVVSEDYLLYIKQQIETTQRTLTENHAHQVESAAELGKRVKDLSTALTTNIAELRTRYDDEILRKFTELNQKIDSLRSDSTTATSTKAQEITSTLTTKIDGVAESLGQRISNVNTSANNAIQSLNTTLRGYVDNITTTDRNTNTTKLNELESRVNNKITSDIEAKSNQLTSLFNAFSDKIQIGGQTPTKQSVQIWFDVLAETPTIRFRKGNQFVGFGAEWK